VLSRLPAVETVGVITAESSELELDSLLARKDVDSVYVCTPYAHTSALVKRSMGYKKKVLSEVPLPKFRDIQQHAIAGDRFLMLAYHRRFDAEYRKAKSFVEDLGAITSLVVESRDIAPHSTDAIDTLYKSVVHDLDTVAWLLEGIDCELSLKSIKIHGPASTMTIVISVWLRKYDKTIDAHVMYGRGYHLYRQHVTVNGRTFGYEVNAPVADFLNTYGDAYARMFQFFANVVATPGQGRECVTYGQAHELLMAVIEKVTDEHELKVAPKHAPQARRGITDDRSPAAQHRGQVPAFEEFRYAVASHGGLFTSGSRLFKPTLYEGHEWTVYSAIREREPQLLPFLPEVFDQIVINDVPYLVMKNLVHGYAKPRILNVKVGEPSDFQKMCYQPYGIRFVGYTGDKIIRRSVPQSWNDMIGYCKDYIKDREANTSRYDNIPHWVKRIRELQEAMAKQQSFRFRATSLLFVYDAVDDAPQKPTVHLIDMARTAIIGGPGGAGGADEAPAAPTPDHFICFGLRNLARILEDIHGKFVNRHAVFLVRHGFRIDYGDLTWVPNSPYPHDPPLSAEGLRQARDLAKRLKYENIDAIVTSPFSRAVQTAKIIAEELHVKYVVEPAFAEFMSVTNRKGVPTLDPQFSRDELMDDTYQQTVDRLSLENWDSMCGRVHEALWRLSRLFKRIAIVSHRSTFQALLSVILGDKFKKQLQFASITSLLPSPNEVGWRIDRLNSYSHLSAILHSPEHNPNYAAGTAAYKDMIVGADGKILPSGWN
jgi:broad specificity phosphatase PhoE/predicted dehydrogenase